MTQVRKFCDYCGRELGEREQYNHLTITHETAPTTWELCAECSKSLFEMLEGTFVFTRGRALRVPYVPCDVCRGRGRDADNDSMAPCGKCNGAGTVPATIPGAKLLPRAEHLVVK